MERVHAALLYVNSVESFLDWFLVSVPSGYAT